MSVINMDQFKAMKEKKERALQYAKSYGVDINTVLEEMAVVEATEVTVTRTISRMEALEALGDDYLTPEDMVKYKIMEDQVISTLDDTVGTRLDTGDYESVDIGLSLLTSDKVVMLPYTPTHDEWHEGPDDDKDDIASEYTNVTPIKWNPDIPW